MNLLHNLNKIKRMVSPLWAVVILIVGFIFSLVFIREIWISKENTKSKEVYQNTHGVITVYEEDRIYQIEACNHEETKGEITVPYDIGVEEATQKEVDEGHSPWRLDPAFVTQVFGSLLLSPEGIVGDYPIAYEDVEITENNSITAIARIHNKKTLAKTVYLKRLVRTDDTGIWTVIGYDKAN